MDARTREACRVRCVRPRGSSRPGTARVLRRTQRATARDQQHMGSTANPPSIGNRCVPAAAGTQYHHAPSQAQLPPAEPPLSKAQLDARFKMEQQRRDGRVHAQRTLALTVDSFRPAVTWLPSLRRSLDTVGERSNIPSEGVPFVSIRACLRTPSISS